MPTGKDLKRLTRSRMKKTGESYTTARAQLLKKKVRSKAAASSSARDAASRSGATPVPRDCARTAGMSDQAVRAGTGRDWAGWVRALDEIGAVRMPHREIAGHLREKDGLPPWWSQMVAVGYERIRGLRDTGQERGGSYVVNKSRTFGAPLAKLYRAFAYTRTRSRWLTGVEVTVRKATVGKSLRMRWEDGTPVDAAFTARGETKSRVTIQHHKLAAKTEAERLRRYWGERLDALAELLEGGGPKRA